MENITLDATKVAEKYLGIPKCDSYDKLWYKSPFCKDDKLRLNVHKDYIYDYGNFKYYSVIEFCQELWKMNVYNTVQKLSQDFNVDITKCLTCEQMQTYLLEKQTIENYKNTENSEQSSKSENEDENEEER